MIRKFFFSILFFFLFFGNRPAFAATTSVNTNYFKAQVTQIVQEGRVINHGISNLYQDLILKIEDGDKNGNTIKLHYGDTQTLTPDQRLKVGDQVVLMQVTTPKQTFYAIYDKYRLNNIYIVLILFVILVLLVARLKGLGSLIGLVTSLAVILLFIIPSILKGQDPLLVSILGSLLILFVTTYVAHGVSKQTTTALLSTSAALFITAILASVATEFSHLTGIGNEDIAQLQSGVTSIINLKGLFLGGIIIGSLGALNDVTITQSATVFELSHHQKDFVKLAKQGFKVGREHILSLVNTLVLAYAGSSLIIFIFIVLNPAKVPYWVILNTEVISGEVVTAVVGSTGLILAVPIVTLLASYVAVELTKSKKS